ncbi:MAG: glycosyltransferase [Candidatus Eisenbacteria bacterium]
MEYEGIRMVPDECEGTGLHLEHLCRYRYAARFAAGRRVLDCASGAGYGSRILREAGALSVTAIDVDPRAVSYGRERYGAGGIEFRVDDVTRLATVEDGSIDLYICFETIEHVRDGESVVREARRVLKEDGLFLCSTPNWEVSRCQNPHHAREYRLGEFRALLAGQFGDLEILFQRNYVAARIAPSPGAAAREEAYVIQEEGIDDDPAEAPYFVAFASRRGVAATGRHALLGPAEMTEKDRRYIQNLEGGVEERDRELERVRSEAEARSAGLEARIVEGKRAIEERDAKIRALQEEGEVRQGAHDAEIESQNRYIQNLEGGVRERDARIRDLEIVQSRRETVLALRLVQLGIRVNRLFGRIPTRTYRFLRSALAREGTPILPSSSDRPLFSILIPVYENFSFLRESIESALGQSFDDFECVIYDDASPDTGVRALLEAYRGHEKASVHFGEENLGLSRALNRCIALSRGRYLAFLDCDDALERDALAKVARRIQRGEGGAADFFYSNRIDVNEAGDVLRFWDFTNRTFGPPAEELLNGMFCSHLKVIRREVLHETGLFRKEFDSAQDYDMTLRLSEGHAFEFIPDVLYRHRVHRSQTTAGSLELQKSLAVRAKETAILRRRVRAGEWSGTVSLVVLSLNRLEDTKRCIRSIARHTPLPHEVIVVDNGSEEASLEGLREFAAADGTFRLHEAGENLRCGGGRNRGVGLARGQYVVFLDNDIEVSAGWLEALIVEMESDERLAACCCRVVFPNGEIQFNGGRTRRGASRIRFDLVDTGKSLSDISAMESRECDWVPGGATIFRRALLEKHPYDTDLGGAYEDNDWSLRVRKEGNRLRNCPLATVIHHHMNFNPEVRKDRHYVGARYDRSELEKTLLHFYKKHGAFIDEEDLYRFVGYEGSEQFMEKHGSEGTFVSR